MVDLVKVGATGHGAGVRQLATRLLRDLPHDVEDAQGFRRALHEAMVSRPTTSLRFTGGAVPTDTEGRHALVDVEPMPDGSGLVLDPAAKSELEEIVAERVRAADLARAGVGATRTLLLAGPPGVGKTLAARWLAQASGLPLVTLDLSAVVSSYLGTSGRNIRAVLDYAKSGPCVLLLDEFDAIAPRRDDDSDIGELRRIVNVVLVELDRWPDTSLLVAATNHAQLLDSAVERRFDRILRLGMPDARARRGILRARAEASPVAATPEVLDLIAEVSSGASGSDLARTWDAAVRRSILNGTALDGELLLHEAKARHAAGTERGRLWSALHDRLGWSYRQIADIAGVTHPTVGAAIRKARSQ